MPRRGDVPGLRSPHHVNPQPPVRVRVCRIHPGPGVVPDPQIPQRHGDPGALVVRGEPAAAAVTDDHPAHRGQSLGGDHVPRGADARGPADLGQQLGGVLLGPASGLAHRFRGDAADRRDAAATAARPASTCFPAAAISAPAG